MKSLQNLNLPVLISIFLSSSYLCNVLHNIDKADIYKPKEKTLTPNWNDFYILNRKTLREFIGKISNEGNFEIDRLRAILVLELSTESKNFYTPPLVLSIKPFMGVSSLFKLLIDTGVFNFLAIVDKSIENNFDLLKHTVLTAQNRGLLNQLENIPFSEFSNNLCSKIRNSPIDPEIYSSMYSDNLFSILMSISEECQNKLAALQSLTNPTEILEKLNSDHFIDRLGQKLKNFENIFQNYIFHLKGIKKVEYDIINLNEYSESMVTCFLGTKSIIELLLNFANYGSISCSWAFTQKISTGIFRILACLLSRVSYLKDSSFSNRLVGHCGDISDRIHNVIAKEPTSDYILDYIQGNLDGIKIKFYKLQFSERHDKKLVKIQNIMMMLESMKVLLGKYTQNPQDVLIQKAINELEKKIKFFKEN